MTMKHWGALGTVPNQCWLKAMSSLSRKEFHLQWEGTEQKEHNRKGAFRPPRCFFSFGPQHWKCSFFWHESFLHNPSSFQNCNLLTKRGPHSHWQGSPFCAGFASSVLVLLPWKCKESQPSPAGPRAPGPSSAAWRAARRMCCKDTAHCGCPQLANCS